MSTETLEYLTEMTWNEMYPDRRPWKQLEQGARDEWLRVFEQFDTNRRLFVGDDHPNDLRYTVG